MSLFFVQHNLIFRTDDEAVRLGEEEDVGCLPLKRKYPETHIAGVQTEMSARGGGVEEEAGGVGAGDHQGERGEGGEGSEEE